MGWLDKIIPKEVKKPFKAVGKLSKNYDTDSMKKINLAFQKHSKGY